MNHEKRILIVDDDPDVHTLLGTVLAAPDRRIESAYDGLAGLQRIEAEPYDLVMTDVIMPGLDGIALLERIHRVRPETKVVVMTAVSTPENIVRSIREHAFAYFSKPFTIDEVKAMVERAFSGGTSEDDIQVLSASPNWLGVRLRCKMETAGRILQFFRELGMDFERVERENVAMAFREIVLNAIEHGAGSDPNKKIVVTYVRTARCVFYYVRDPGKGFSFHNLDHAAVSNPPESPIEHSGVRERLGLRPGGFGILMTRQLVDEMIYNEKGNEVLLIKYL